MWVRNLITLLSLDLNAPCIIHSIPAFQFIRVKYIVPPLSTGLGVVTATTKLIATLSTPS